MNPWEIQTVRPEWTAQKKPAKREPYKRKVKFPPNPWGLFTAQLAAMEALISAGGIRQAARVLNVSHKAVEKHVQACKEKMGAVSTIAAALMFDRWKNVRDTTWDSGSAEQARPLPARGSGELHQRAVDGDDGYAGRLVVSCANGAGTCGRCSAHKSIQGEGHEVCHSQNRRARLADLED